VRCCGPDKIEVVVDPFSSKKGDRDSAPGVREEKKSTRHTGKHTERNCQNFILWGIASEGGG